MSKKLLIVIIIILVIILGVSAYFMLHSPFGKPATGFSGTKTYSDNQGSVTIGNTATVPSNWPSDVPANYTGAKMLYSGNSNPKTGTAGVIVSYSVQATAKAISDYYETGLKAQGWTIEGNANVGRQTIIGAKKGSRTFGATIVDNGNQTVTVTIGAEL